MEEGSTQISDNRFSDENVKRVIFNLAPRMLFLVGLVYILYMLYGVYSYGFEGYLNRLCGHNDIAVSPRTIDLCFSPNSGIIVFAVGVFALLYLFGFSLRYFLKRKS